MIVNIDNDNFGIDTFPKRHPTALSRGNKYQPNVPYTHTINEEYKDNLQDVQNLSSQSTLKSWVEGSKKTKSNKYSKN